LIPHTGQRKRATTIAIITPATHAGRATEQPAELGEPLNSCHAPDHSLSKILDQAVASKNERLGE
jgi:hypothetical protein